MVLKHALSITKRINNVSAQADVLLLRLIVLLVQAQKSPRAPKYLMGDEDSERAHWNLEK